MTTRRRLVIVALAVLTAIAAHHAAKAWITHILRRLP